MSSAELQTAIYAKYNAEEITGAVLYYGRALSGAVKPYIVFSFLPNDDISTFRTSIKDEEIQFNIIDDQISATNLYAIKEDLIEIFHKQILTVVNYRNVELFNNLNAGPFTTEDNDTDMQYTVTFEGKAQRE